ncbi:MAG: AI-2E family transporter [Butyrivibrio sp.]|nr:AI-2E family transporter [Butyrivibrio sp.]
MNLKNRLKKKKWISYTIATCSAVVLYIILSNLYIISEGLNSFYTFIKPIVVGVIIAYLLNPLAKVFDLHVFKKIKKESARWTLSAIVAIFVILLAIVLLFVALIPQLIDSVSTFINSVGGYVDSLQKLLRDFEAGTTLDIFNNIADVSDRILTNIKDYFTYNMGNVLNTSANIGKSVMDLVLGFILAIYLLLDKKRTSGGIRKLLGLIMKPERYVAAGDIFRRSNDIIIRYISFDLIDGIIVGVVNLIFMLIMGMPYAVLISVVVGVTNLAPTFGPIVGAIIGGFVLVLVKPWYALAFLLFTVGLQIVDGYILKPKLFGDSLGISPLMILVAIILGGRLFGVGGILLAIPFAAILDFVYRDFVIKRLEEKRSTRYNKL